jgi:hypothetical protein
MTIGLPIQTLIAVSVVLSPPAAQFANFNSLLIIGDSNVIDVHERMRTYTALSQVATDFGTSAPEYLAASLYFGQAPQPTTLYIGRWAKVATAGLLRGGTLSATQQALSNFTGIANGGFHITIDGGASTNVTGINLTAVSNLNGVAAAIQTALQALGGSFAAVTCTWNSTYGQFTIRSGTTGTSSAVSVTTAPTAGTDLGPLILTTAATDTYTVAGIAAETAVAAVTLIDTTIPTQWYALSFAAGTGDADIVDADHLAIAAYIEGAGTPHLYGLTTAEAAALVIPDTTSIGAQLKALGYNRTFYQYSSTNPYAVASLIGRMATVNFNAAGTTITPMYKQEPGVSAETLTQSQAAALNANNYNYYANFNNNTAIIVNGMVASGQFLDTVWGVDWLANAIQTNVYNALLTATTKIPQTDAGNNQIAGAIGSACVQGVANGLLAPGTWTSGGFGQIKNGSFLPNGYYIFVPPISTQAQADRSARKSVPIQVAAKLAGAIHTVNVTINVNQ